MSRAIVVATMLLATAGARGETVAELVRNVDGAKGSISSLSGEFTQRNRVKLFKQEMTSKGRFSFARPRHIKWEYLSPDPSVMTLDGNRATVTTPGAAPQEFDLEHDATMRAIFDQLLVWLGSGSIATASGDYDMEADGATLALTPKASSPVAKAFTRVELRFDPKTWLVRSIRLVEKNGDEKEIGFTKLQKR